MQLYDQVAVAVLAGGKSSRMGRSKPDLPAAGNDTLLTRLCSAVGDFRHRYLCVNASQQELQVPGFVRIVDRYEGAGPAGAICTLLGCIETDAVLVLACDMPYYDRSAAEEILSHYRGEDVVTAVTAGRRQPVAAIYHKRLLPLFEHAVERGELRPGRIIEPAGGVFFQSRLSRQYLNLNTPEEYREYCRSEGIDPAAAEP